MKRPGMWIGMLALLAALAAMFFLRGPTPQARVGAVATAGSEPLRSTAPSPTARNVANRRPTSAHASNAVPGHGLGGEHLDLKASLDAAIAERGRDDALVFEMARTAVGACANAEALRKDPVARRDPRRAWAIDYLTRACVGFDADAYAWSARPNPPDSILAREQGDAAADAVALEQLRTSVSTGELTLAGLQLFSTKHFPLEADASLDYIEQLNALDFATVRIRCNAFAACGTDSVLTAVECANDGCALGTTYEQARRQHVSPREYEAAMKMRRDLVLFRNTAPR